MDLALLITFGVLTLLIVVLTCGCLGYRLDQEQSKVLEASKVQFAL